MILKIVYNCFGGSHASVTAAAIHLGLIPNDRIPTAKELTDLPYYDGQVNKDHGRLRYIGKDEFDNEVYIVGRRYMSKAICNLLSGVAKIFNIDEEEYIFVDALPYVNWQMVVGGYLSRKMGWVKLGRPIVIMGTQKSFLKLVTLVHNVKIRLPKG